MQEDGQRERSAQKEIKERKNKPFSFVDGASLSHQVFFFINTKWELYKKLLCRSRWLYPPPTCQVSECFGHVQLRSHRKKKRKTNAFSSSSKCYVCIWFASSLRRWAFVKNTLHLGAQKSKYYSKILPHLSSLWLSSDKSNFWTWGLAEDLFFLKDLWGKKNLYNNNLLRVSEIHQGGNIAGAQTTRWMLNVNYLLTTGQI